MKKILFGVFSYTNIKLGLDSGILLPKDNDYKNVNIGKCIATRCKLKKLKRKRKLVTLVCPLGMTDAVKKKNVIRNYK